MENQTGARGVWHLRGLGPGGLLLALGSLLGILSGCLPILSFGHPVERGSIWVVEWCGWRPLSSGLMIWRGKLVLAGFVATLTCAVLLGLRRRLTRTTSYWSFGVGVGVVWLILVEAIQRILVEAIQGSSAAADLRSMGFFLVQFNFGVGAILTLVGSILVRLSRNALCWSSVIGGVVVLLLAVWLLLEVNQGLSDMRFRSAQAFIGMHSSLGVGSILTLVASILVGVGAALKVWEETMTRPSRETETPPNPQSGGQLGAE